MIEIIQETHITNAIIALNKIPEFNGGFAKEDLEFRLKNDPVILIAFHENKPIACKIGYNRYLDGSFYSWLGGVIPEYRKMKVATQLNYQMELITREKGYTSILFKTRNRYKAMLHLGLKNNYNIIGFEEKESVSDHRIILNKTL